MTTIKNLLIVWIIFIHIGFFAGAALCLWPDDPTQNIPVCTVENIQEFPFVVTDGAGGVIVIWHDVRDGNRDIYAQRINAEGEMQWSLNGIAAYAGEHEQGWPVAVSDGAGGAIIAWGDGRNNRLDIYAQRVNANGKLLWDAAGVPVCVDDARQEGMMAIEDGFGGVIFVWEDSRNGNQDIYAQRLNARGKPVWTPNGVPVSAAAGDQYDPCITTDGVGGIIGVWWDISSPDWNICVQRLDAQGKPVWGKSGVMVCGEPGAQGNPFIASDGSGGACVVWVDYRNDETMSKNGDIYAQRLNANGAPLWAKGGVPVCNLPANQQQAAIISDGAGGAIIAWWDDRDVYSDIYIQRIGGDGTARWLPNGVPVCVAEGIQSEPQLIADDAGGAIIFWKDYRRDYGEQTLDDIYAQRINAAGEFLWEHNGIAVCTADGTQTTPRAASDGAGGIFIAWTDKRGGEEDIYIQLKSKE